MFVYHITFNSFLHRLTRFPLNCHPRSVSGPFSRCSSYSCCPERRSFDLLALLDLFAKPGSSLRFVSPKPARNRRTSLASLRTFWKDESWWKGYFCWMCFRQFFQARRILIFFVLLRTARARLTLWSSTFLRFSLTLATSALRLAHCFQAENARRIYMS